MNKNPVWVLTGLAVAAVGAVAGLTTEKWLPRSISPAELAVTQAPADPPATPAAPAEPAPETRQQAEAPAPEVQAPETTASETTASETTAPAAAETPAAQPETPVEQAAAPEADVPATAAAEPEAAPVVTPPEQQTADPAPATPPTTTPTVAEQVPAFDTVRVEKTGEAVIAGTAEAGAEVVVKLDGKEIGKTIANGDGAFVVIPDAPLPSGSGALTIEATGAGDVQPTPSEQVVAVIVPENAAEKEALVAVVSPGEPTKVLQAPETPAAEAETKTDAEVAAVQPEAATPEQAAAPSVPAGAAKRISLDAVDYDQGGNIVFSGRGQAGLGARVYVDNAHLGDAVIGNDGRWAYAGNSAIAPGVHTLRVDGLDGTGKVINRIEVPFFREDTTKLASAGGSTTDVPDQTATKSEDGQAAASAGEGAGADAAPKPKDGRVVIQPGNNLWRISKVLYGDGAKFAVIYQANKDQIRDPDRIYPGQVFKTPDAVAPADTVDPDRREPLSPEEGAAPAQ